MHGLVVTSTPEARSIAVHPYLGDFGRRELRQVFGGLLLGYGLLEIGRWIVAAGFTGTAFGLYLLAILTVAAGLGSASWFAISEHRRSRLALDVRLGASTVDLVWRRGATVTRSARFQLRDIGRVDVREVGYQRWHVVARLPNDVELEIPMERDSREASRWVADELAEAGRAARAGT